MKKLMKKTAVLLSAAMVFSVVPVFADVVTFEETEAQQSSHSEADEEAYQVYNDGQETAAAVFMSVSGEVKEITPHHDEEDNVVDGVRYIRIEGESGTAVLRTDFNTFVLGDEVEVGDNITGYYASGPMMLIYPPQHTVRLIVNGEFENVKIDRFELNTETDALVSESGMLQLNYTDETPIILQDGRDFRQDLEEIRSEYEELGLELPHGLELPQALDGRLLVVTYGPTTRSIPAITIPESDEGLKIIVMFEEAVHPIGNLGEIGIVPPIYEDDNLLGSWPINEVVVHGEIIEAAEWVVENGTYYVPFRAVIDALGFGGTIAWDGETNTVTVSNGDEEITFVVGGIDYHVDGVVRTLEPASILLNERTYVPFKFFQEVFGLNNAWMHGGQIIFDNEEPMF